MKKSNATTTAEAPVAIASSETIPGKPVKFTPPGFDAKAAYEIPHSKLYAHGSTGRTVGFHQPVIADRIGKGAGEPVTALVHLFGVNRRYIATVPAADVIAITMPGTTPPTAVAAVNGEVVQVPTSEAPAAETPAS